MQWKWGSFVSFRYGSDGSDWGSILWMRVSQIWGKINTFAQRNATAYIQHACAPDDTNGEWYE